MKEVDIKSMNIEELKDKISSEKEMFYKLKLAHAISPIENPTTIKITRKFIAQLMTELTVKLKSASL